MQRFKKLLKIIFCPPLFCVLLCGVCAVAALIWVFGGAHTGSPVVYFIYPFSAYALCVLLVYWIPRAVAFIKKPFSKIPIMDRYFSDRIFRAQVSVYIGLIFNTLYSVFYFVMAFTRHSYWQGTLAAYNLILSGMRFMLVRNFSCAKKQTDETERQRAEWKAYRRCGLLMFVMSVAVIGMIDLLISDGTNAGGEILTIMIAAYTFYCVILAIVNVVKFRKQGSPILSASKNICFVRALMSLFSLQITMFAQFGGADGDGAFVYAMDIALGVVVSLLSVSTAAAMLLRARRRLKALNEKILPPALGKR